ncbi:hypothetical protein [Teredinibacter haidensis]|uniref:hypothetical protein n=1 Tax=Teredinibacter haidensis TaxID=2731755 RepID=UPI000948C300|nr:hypothetical protein [Teredinibacter haidensis]
MMKLNRIGLLFIYLASFMLVGCGGGNTVNPGIVPQPTGVPEPTAPPPPARSLLEAELIDSIEVLLDEEDCLDSEQDACAETEHTYAPPAPQERADQEARILILDWGIHSHALLGYRKRVLNTFEFDNELNIIESRPKVTLSTLFDTIFTTISDHPHFVSVSRFQKFQDHKNIPLLDKLTAELAIFGHGYFISSFLFEHNPNAKFVLVELGKSDRDLLTPDGYCKNLLSSDTELQGMALSEITNRYSRFLGAIEGLVSRYEIDYINASWGTSAPVIRRQISAVCDGEAPPQMVEKLQIIDRDFIRQLSALKYVNSKTEELVSTIVVQAGAVLASEPLLENHPEFLSDCDSSTMNRVRVQGLENDGMTIVIPENGTDNTNAIQPTSLLDYLACTDLYVPLGIYTDESLPPPLIYALREKSFKTIMHGFLEREFFPGLRSSSFAPPIVISALNYYQQQSSERLSTKELISRMAGNGIISDPLLYDKFIVYSDGYRE